MFRRLAALPGSWAQCRGSSFASSTASADALRHLAYRSRKCRFDLETEDLKVKSAQSLIFNKATGKSRFARRRPPHLSRSCLTGLPWDLSPQRVTSSCKEAEIQVGSLTTAWTPSGPDGEQPVPIELTKLASVEPEGVWTSAFKLRLALALQPSAVRSSFHCLAAPFAIRA